MNTLSAKIMDGVYYLGVNDRDTALFENMWPLPKGLTYNAYMILDEKTALLDTVKIIKVEGFLNNVKGILENRPLDYLILQHMEPDHSGCVREIIQLYPNVKLVGNKKTRAMLKDYLGIEQADFFEIGDGDVLNLGKRNLVFHMTPMVHWPETFVSYEPEDKILFSQDIFGGFGSVNGTIFDDEMNYDFYQDETRRYYSNVIGKYSAMARKALDKLESLEIEYICPIHGMVWRDNPDKIMKEYKSWANYETEQGILIIYGSMYGTTETMADYLARFVAQEGIKNVKVFDVSKTHPSYLISEIWKYSGLILGSCTYNNAVYPVMYNLLNLLKMNKIEKHKLGIFGSYGWSGGAVKDLKAFAEGSKYDVCETIVETKGSPKDPDIENLRALAREMAAKVKES